MPWFHGHKMESLYCSVTYKISSSSLFDHTISSFFSTTTRNWGLPITFSPRPCRSPSPDDSSRQMARHSCGRVHRALGCPVSNNRLAQFGAKNGWVLMTTTKCSVTTCKAHDQHEQIMKTSWIDASPKWCFYWRGKTFQSSMSPWAWYTIKWSV